MKRKLFIFGAAVLLTCAVLWLAGSTLSSPAHMSVGGLPSDLAGRSVEFPSESGAIIHGWLIPGRKGGGAIVLMHGLRANRLSMLERARFLSRAGYSVLVFDFQAHGESDGEHITFGHLESRDALAAVNFLRTNSGNEKIGVVGVSMGGAAVLLASPPLQVDAMVLEMVYPAIDQAITNRLTMRLGAPGRLLTPLLSWQLKPRLGISIESLRPIDHVRETKAAKLFIAGAQDQHTTIQESRQIFDVASEPKELWTVDDAAHVDLHRFARIEYERRVLEFFGKHLRQGSHEQHE